MGEDDPGSPEVFARLYADLRDLAGSVWSRNPGATLQPTALLHEAWLRMAQGVTFDSEEHFKAIAARAMRQVLVDHARRRATLKRGGDRQQVTLGDLHGPEQSLDILDLERGLAQLEQLSPRQARVAELRVFGGLDHAEIGRLVGVTDRTVRTDWRLARAWLLRWLSEPSVPPAGDPG